MKQKLVESPSAKSLDTLHFLEDLEKRDGVHNIWRQPLDGAAPTQITNFTEDLIYNYDLFADDARLIVSRGLKTRDIVLIRNFQ